MKSISKVLNTFENIMENGANKCSIFHNIFKYVAFRRSRKALLWNKRVKHKLTVIIFLPINSNIWEHSGSVVERLTRDPRATGLSLTSITALCP